jgi:hypothetical protein
MDIDVDYRYEFCAPMFYDFRYEETDADIAAAERWFDSALPYEASPHVAKTKSIPELCSAAFNFGLGGNLEAQQVCAPLDLELWSTLILILVLKCRSSVELDTRFFRDC